MPPDGTLDGVRAFDTGPGVAVIDAVVRERSIQRSRIRRDGELAARGHADRRAWSTSCSRIRTSRAAPPKSHGPRAVRRAYVERLIDRCRARRPSVRDEDIVATATSLTARSIADAYRRFMPEPVDRSAGLGRRREEPDARAR